MISKGKVMSPIPPKCIYLPFLINWVQGEIIENMEIDIRANWLFWSAWRPERNNQ